VSSAKIDGTSLETRVSRVSQIRGSVVIIGRKLLYPVKLRFEQHQKGQVESTKKRIPLTLIYYEVCLNQEDATRREKYFKTHYGKLFLKKRLKSYFTGLT